jgi:hypothetical protein
LVKGVIIDPQAWLPHVSMMSAARLAAILPSESDSQMSRTSPTSYHI